MNLSDGSALLNEADFVRLLRGAAFSVLSKRLGLPPLLPGLDEISARPLAALNPGDHWPEIHCQLLSFLGLAETEPPDVRQESGRYVENLRTRWLKDSRRLVFFTSGSTGRPKASPHSEALVRQEAGATGQLFQGVRRILVTVPLLHSYGFIFGLMLAKTLAVPAIDLPPLPTVLAENLSPGDLAVGFPLLLSALGKASAPTTQLLTSTAPCPDELFQATVDKGYRLTEIYGASETGAVAVRYAPGPFRLLNHWLRGDEENLLRQQPDGPQQQYPLPDKLLWRDGRRFVPAGRLDRAVQVAGVNVYPARVAAVLLEHPAVDECAVRLMSPGEGFRLKAFIVPKGGHPEPGLRLKLRQFIKTRLSPPERPGRLSFGPELPRSPTGKDADWPLVKSTEI